MENQSEKHVKELKLLQKQKILEVHFEDGTSFELPCSYLRTHTPSAKADLDASNIDNVNVIGIDPIGNYAVKLIFDDGHDTGIYSWDFLYKLGIQQKSP